MRLLGVGTIQQAVYLLNLLFLPISMVDWNSPNYIVFFFIWKILILIYLFVQRI